MTFPAKFPQLNETQLTEHARTVLIRVIRVAFPHSRIPDGPYERTADIILLSREALAAGLERTFSRPERIRPWTYDFDPSGLELLRRAIEHVTELRPAEAAAG